MSQQVSEMNVHLCFDCTGHSTDRRVTNLDSGPDSWAGFWGEAVNLLLSNLSCHTGTNPQLPNLMQGIMLASVLTASKVDEYIARAQRRDLGLCEECGGVNEPETCDQNKCPYNKKQT